MTHGLPPVPLGVGVVMTPVLLSLHYYYYTPTGLVHSRCPTRSFENHPLWHLNLLELSGVCRMFPWDPNCEKPWEVLIC